MNRGLFLALALVMMLWLPSMGQVEKKANVYLYGGNDYKNVTLLEVQKDFILVLLGESDEGSSEIKLRIPTETIRKIKYIQANSERIKMKRTPIPYESKPYYVVELGALIGNQDAPYLFTKGVIGYRFNQFLSSGVGIGLDTYGDFSTMPVFFDFRGNLGKEKISPFYYFQAGYSKAWYTDEDPNFFIDRDIEGDWKINPGIGLRINTGNADVIFTLGYNRQKVKFTENSDWGGTTITRRKVNRMTIGMGIQF